VHPVRLLLVHGGNGDARDRDDDALHEEVAQNQDPDRVQEVLADLYGVVQTVGDDRDEHQIQELHGELPDSEFGQLVRLPQVLGHLDDLVEHHRDDDVHDIREYCAEEHHHVSGLVVELVRHALIHQVCIQFFVEELTSYSVLALTLADLIQYLVLLQNVVFAVRKVDQPCFEVVQRQLNVALNRFAKGFIV